MGGPDPDRNSRVRFQRRSQTLEKSASAFQVLNSHGEDTQKKGGKKLSQTIRRLPQADKLGGIKEERLDMSRLGRLKIRACSVQRN
jgi:hypothetical protein